MKPGDTFTWKDTNTHWLVYMQKLEETAYFRAEIRRCAYTFTIDGKTYTYEVIDHSNAIAGEETYKRPIIIIPEITCGLRKLKNIPVALVKSRENKATNMLLNRDAMSKLGYVINPNTAHILTKEMEKVKII